MQTTLLGKRQTSSYLRLLGLGLLFLALQWLVLGRLRIFGAYPDAVLLFVAWIGLRQGRETGTIFGFIFGFLMDAIYGTWGLHMLAKTLIGFLVGTFPASERETLHILPQQALLGGLVTALLHNGILVLLLAIGAGTRNTFVLLVLWIGSALYTAAVAFFTSLFMVR